MSSLWITTALLASFAATHIALASPPLRGWLVGRLRRQGFAVGYSLVAWVTLGAAILYYAGHAAEGPAGLGLTAVPWVRVPAMAAIYAGVVLMVAIASPRGYVRSAHLVLSNRTPGPEGLERITRHPFFVGMALFGVGHALLATRAVGIVVFGTLAALALGGSMLLDRKLLRRRGEPYAAYLQQTSAVPLGAVVAGRQRIALGELPWVFALGGLLLGLGARSLHGTGFAWGAHLVLAALVVGPTVFVVVGNRRRAAERRAP